MTSPLHTHPPIASVLVQPALRRAAPSPVPLADRLAQLGVPGLSIALLGEGDVVTTHCVGVREAGRPDPVSPDTLFQAASISKPVTAFAVLRLVERGTLDLDADVNECLRSWRVPANGDWQPRVTLRQLITHSAGLTVHGFPGYPPEARLPTLPQILDGHSPANTPPVRVDTLPGLQHRYSGGGYCVLQQLLEDATAQPFPHLVRDLVLRPCGMERSTMEQPLPSARRAEAATGHRTGAGPVSGGHHVYPEMAAAGLWTTPSDLIRFAIQVRRAVAGHAGALLSPGIAMEMLSPQVERFAGLGFVLGGQDEARAAFFHGGANEGFRCQLTVFRNRPLGAAVMTNADAGGQLLPELMRALDQQCGWGGFVGPTLPEPVAVDPGVLAAVAGDYEIAVARGSVRLTLSEESGSLRVLAAGQPPLTLHAETESRFFADEANVELGVTKDETGVTSITLRQNGRDMRAVRIGPTAT